VRGGLAAAAAGGRVLLLDPRVKWQAGASTLAHVGGLLCMEVSGVGWASKKTHDYTAVLDCRFAGRVLLPVSQVHPTLYTQCVMDSCQHHKFILLLHGSGFA
jgi:hypothetical protein